VTAPLIISISHSLGKEEALRRLKPGLRRMTAGLPILSVEQEAWSGDHMEFQIKPLGQSASGAMDVADDHASSCVCRGFCNALRKASATQYRRVAAFSSRTSHATRRGWTPR
jgi:hypothetical protein